MKRTTTEIFIEVEEIIRVKSATRKKPSGKEPEDKSKPVTEICPHCRQVVFDPIIIEREGDSEI